MTTTQTRRTRPTISQPLLLDAALDLIQQNGLEVLSMRKLGEKFEIQAASIYWYVKSKEELLDLLADELYGRAATCLHERDYETLAPAACLHAALNTYREFLLRHAHLAEVFGLSLPVGPGYAMLVEELLDPVRRMRLWPSELAGDVEKQRETMGQIIGLLLDYVHGAVRTQQAPISGRRSMVEAIVELDANLHLANSGVAAGLHRDFAERFQFGLSALITGLQHRFG